ncbi:helix-turn-helix transcriptional regulator [Methylobacillus caricis]|uniref:helix-turn-helix domain-containing protein n=1 Tax=Methylobacillus caricis TaxID=1971611 RepID=UPI001CFFB806|nr:helix-turn-helix transcriptional regulator [Methylobacillus caricis]MCB5188877.1 helix-turn-helix transcriptional regulator [Methylobacillus caricis]
MNTNSYVDNDEQRRLLAQRLKESREYCGLSQEEVAGVLGVTRPAISNIESGSRKVEAIELDKLSTLYGRTIQYFLNGEVEFEDDRVAFLARATQGMAENDLKELERFARFLRNSPGK